MVISIAVNEKLDLSHKLGIPICVI